jgi:hypothetical protein
MRRLFLPVGLAAIACTLVIACSDLEPTNPSEPQFGKKAVNCDLGDLEVLATTIRTEINALFSAKKKSKAAHEIFNNIERKVCKDQYSDALDMALGFYEMTYDQLPDKLNGDAADAAALVNLVFQFAGSDSGGSPPPTIPSGALEPTGGIGVVYPGTNDTIWTNNDEAAFVANAGSFGGNEPVTVVLVRLPDPILGVLGDPIPGYQAYPEAYDFFSNVDLVGEAEFWMCVVTDPPAPPFERLVIGHDLGEGSELLTPRLLEDYPGQVLDCGDAVRQPEGPVVGEADTPGWLRFAGELLRPVADRLLGVKPLNATFFAGRGLGGRGTSFSAFAPVDGGVPHPELEYIRAELNQPVGSDTFNYYYVGVTNWEDYPAALFVNSTDYPCGENPSAARTRVEIFDAADGSRIYGFCDFDSPDDLLEFWFSTPPGQAPPDVYIELWDQEEGVRYRSNTISVPTVFNTLTVEGNGAGSGTVTRSPDINCYYDGETTAGDCQHSAEQWVRYGTLVATPDAGSTFAGWSGACTGTGGCDVDMDANKTVAATFEPTVTTYTLTISIPSGPGNVVDAGGDIDCSSPSGDGDICTFEYTPGTTVTLTGTPESGWYYAGSSENCSSTEVYGDCEVLIDGPKTVEVYFEMPV